MAEEHINTSVGAECGGTAPAVCTGTTEHWCCTLALVPAWRPQLADTRWLQQAR